MRRAAAIAAVAAAAVAAGAPAPARADELDATAAAAREAAETIEITDLRVPRKPAAEPAAITVLERAELARSPALTTDDALRAVPSVAMFRRSSSLIADPTSQGLNLRGVGPSAVARALVLRDGIPINDPFGGWVYWRAIPTAAIERVEIQPSGATLFGNAGLGGIVALASRPITEPTAEATFAAGSHGTTRGALRGAGRLAGFGVELDADRLTSDGYAPIAADQRGAVDGPAAGAHTGAGVRLERTDGGSTVRAFGRWFDQELDAGTRFTTAAVRTVTYGASWRYARAASRLDVAAFAGHQRFEQTRARVAPGRADAELASAQTTPSNNQGASAMWSRRAGERHTIQLGVDALRVAGTATDRLTPAMPTDASVVERAAGGEQRFAGVFAQDAIRATPSLELTAALRLDGWQQRDGHRRIARAGGEVTASAFDDRGGVQLGPRLGALHHIDANLAVRGSVYRAFRAPTLNELYRPFQVGTVLTAANDALRPEVLWGGELGPQVVVGTLVARATAFYNRMTDPVFNATLAEPAPDGATRRRDNLGRARIAGLELELSWRPAAAWIVTVACTMLDARVTAAPGQPELVGKWLAQDPRLRATGALAFDDPRIVTAGVEARFTSRQFEDDLNTLPMGAFTVIDAFARRHLARGLSVFATALNVLDRRYLVGRAGIDTIGLPRTILGGLTFAVP